MKSVGGVTFQEWFTLAELAGMGLAGLPGSKQGLHKLADREGWAARASAAGPLCRPRKARGGGVEYHYSLLPEATQAALLEATVEQEKIDEAPDRDLMWARWERLPESMREEARRRLEAVKRVESLFRGGLGKSRAIEEVVAQARREERLTGQSAFGESTLYAWMRMVASVRPDDWLVYLTPNYTGRVVTAPCDQEAWDLFKADYLRPERPTYEACYRRVAQVAAEKGLALPSLAALRKRLGREVPDAVQAFLREGAHTADHAHPHLTRSRRGLAPLEIVDLDGHTFDNDVLWPDGEVSRPIGVFTHCIGTGMLLAVRLGKTLNRHLVRLALADTFRDYGIPSTVIMDNGRENTSLDIAGGQRTNRRGEAKHNERSGLLETLNITSVFTTPYWGQAKPIERVFRDFAHDFAKHPALAGSYTGHNAVEKPANRGSRALPVAEFERLLRQEIAAWNAREGRRGVGMNGRSFLQVYRDGVERHGVKRATPEQLRLALMHSDPVTVERQSKAFKILGNRYWSEGLLSYRGTKVIARYDPDDLGAPVYVYAWPGKTYLGEAKRLQEGNFNSVRDAEAHGRERRKTAKLVKELAARTVKATPAQLAEIYAASTPEAPPAPAPETNVTRPAFGTPRTPQAQTSADFTDDWLGGVAHLGVRR